MIEYINLGLQLASLLVLLHIAKYAGKELIVKQKKIHYLHVEIENDQIQVPAFLLKCTENNWEIVNVYFLNTGKIRYLVKETI